MPGPEYSSVLPLFEPQGYQLRQSEAGRGYYESEQPGGGASLSGPVPSYQTGAQELPASAEPKPVHATSGMGGSKRPTPGEVAHRALNPEELMALAQQMQEDISSQTAAVDRSPTAVEGALTRDQGAPYWLRSYMGE